MNINDESKVIRIPLASTLKSWMLSVAWACILACGYATIVLPNPSVPIGLLIGWSFGVTWWAYKFYNKSAALHNHLIYKEVEAGINELQKLLQNSGTFQDKDGLTKEGDENNVLQDLIDRGMESPDFKDGYNDANKDNDTE